MKKTFLPAVLAMITAGVINSNAQTVLGSFQGASDPTDAGWVNPNTGNSITTDAADSFVAGGVPGYGQSLQITGTSGSFGSDSLELQFSPAQVAAFNANSYLTFTFSVPSGASTAGYSQIYNIAMNAPGYGYNNIANGGNAAATWGTYGSATGTTGNNQNGEPNFYFYSGDPALQSQTVTFNYSSYLSAIEAGGESYLQMTFQGNQGGTAPNFIYMNNVGLSTGPFGASAVPEPGTLALGLFGASAFLMRRRMK